MFIAMKSCLRIISNKKAIAAEAIAFLLSIFLVR
jgi:hypothetical protein